MNKPVGLYALSPDKRTVIYGPEEERDLSALLDFRCAPADAKVAETRPADLSEVEILVTGWGAPRLDADFLSKAPKLKAVFYGAGSIKSMVTDEFWAKGIPVVSAWSANAVPVAEFTLAEILFSLKHGWKFALDIKREGKHASKQGHVVPGAWGTTVGLLSLGMIGRMVVERLKGFDVKVIAYDPFLTDAQAAEMGVRKVDLDTVFSESDVVSCHTPWLKETEKLLTEAHFARMKLGATFINTARGAVVDEPGLISVLQKRPDLMAVLDVTYPEPPVEGSPFYTLPNVVLTPHIAGSMDNECRRMGRLVVDELKRFLSGEKMKWSVSKEMAARMA